MNLLELKEAVDNAIDYAKEIGESPEEISVSIQVDKEKDSVWSDDVELHYDNNACASGCVIVGEAHE